MSVRVGKLAHVLPCEGFTRPSGVQSAPSLVETATAMFDFVVPPKVRPRKSTVRLVKPTVEKAGDTTVEEVWVMAT